MASQSADPAAPQSEVITVAGANKPARKGTYVDTSLTTRNAESDAPALDLPAGSGSTTLGSTRPVYAGDQDNEIDNTAAIAAANASVDPPPHSPNSPRMQTRSGRRYARDPYANGGQAQYLNNQGG